jgi:hypothetical protein
MNRQQILDVLKGLLVAGGPIVALLVHLFGMESGEAEKIVQAFGAVVSVGGIVWLALGRTDGNLVKDAASVKGVQVHVDSRVAPDSAVEAARNPEVKDVVPMVGGPRHDANKTS